MTSHQEYLAREPNLQLAARLKIGAWIVTAIVLAVVGLMRQIKIPLPEGMSLAFLPAVNAALNTVVTALLCLALLMIKRRAVQWHKRAINAAMVCSILFLTSYTAYHLTTPETSFGGSGGLQVIYYLLLISHVVLAAISLPFILFTWIYGFTNQFQTHRKYARWVFPVWLYVSITGPVCYLMLRPYY